MGKKESEEEKEMNEKEEEKEEDEKEEDEEAGSGLERLSAAASVMLQSSMLSDQKGCEGCLKCKEEFYGTREEVDKDANGGRRGGGRR